MTADSGLHEHCGVIHIHSRYSDGSGTTRQIIKAAQKTALDYIIVTDHNTLKAMDDEGWYDGLLVLAGEEIGHHEGSHYLAFGVSDTIKPEDHQLDTRQYAAAVERQGGIGFAPHPNGLHNASLNLHLPSWNTWEDPGYTGVEIWSHTRDWAENITPFNILLYYLRPEMTISGPSPDLLQRWDQLGQTRRAVGIGGSDAHAPHMPLFNCVKFLSYKRSFRGIRTHLLTTSPLSPDLHESKEQVYTALKSGHCFFAHDLLADSAGFGFRAFTSDGQTLSMGDEAKLASEVKLEVTSPVPAALRLLRDGEIVKEAGEARELTWEASRPGVYRVEACYNGRIWVFTNPIYLR